MNEYYNATYSLLRSIFSQRLLLIRFSKCKSPDLDSLKMKTEELNNQLENYHGDKGIAYFLSENYETIKSILPKGKGWQLKMSKLNTLYYKSKFYLA